MNELIVLKNKMADLLSWKKTIETQQVHFPLDYQSTLEFQRMMIVVKNKVLQSPLLDALLAVFGMEVLINEKKYLIYTSLIPHQFTANAGTDKLTNVSGNVNFTDNTQLVFFSTDTLPNGISFAQQYYPVTISSATFKISADPLGSPIDILDSGIGTHYFYVANTFTLI